MAEWLAGQGAPRAVRAVVQNAIKRDHDEKLRLVRSLVQNIRDDDARHAAGNRLMRMDMDDLLTLAPAMTTNKRERHASYAGAGAPRLYQDPEPWGGAANSGPPVPVMQEPPTINSVLTEEKRQKAKAS